MKRLIVIYILIFSSNILLAQSYITGIVTNTKGETIPFATIQIDKTTKGVSADKNGTFQLKTTKIGQITLIASSAGYISINRSIAF